MVSEYGFDVEMRNGKYHHLLILVSFLGCSTQDDTSRLNGPENGPSQTTLNAPNGESSQLVTVDLGILETSTKATKILRIPNPFKKEIKISGFQSDCGCTAASISQAIVQMGAAAEIEVTFNAGTESGVYEKYINVKAAHDGPDYAVIKILAKSRKQLNISPTAIDETVTPNDPRPSLPASVTIANYSPVDWEGIDFVSNAAWLRSGMTVPQSVPKEGNSGLRQQWKSSYSFETASLKPGVHRATITIMALPDRHYQGTVPIHLTVKPPYSIAPEHLVFTKRQNEFTRQIVVVQNVANESGVGEFEARISPAGAQSLFQITKDDIDHTRVVFRVKRTDTNTISSEIKSMQIEIFDRKQGQSIGAVSVSLL